MLTWHNPKRGATCDDVKHPDASSYGANGANDDPDASSNAGIVNGVAWRTAPRAKDEPAHAALVSHFAAFANGDSEVGSSAGHHVLVHGPVGAGKRWLLMSSLGVCLGLQHDTSKGRPSKSPASALRVVRVPREALRQLPELCRFAGDHPRGEVRVSAGHAPRAGASRRVLQRAHVRAGRRRRREVAAQRHTRRGGA